MYSLYLHFLLFSYSSFQNIYFFNFIFISPTVSIEELLIMSNNRRSDVSIVNTFNDLDVMELDLDTCGQPEGDYFLTVK